MESRDYSSNKVATALAGSMVRLQARIRREASDLAGEWSWPQLMTLARIIDKGPTTVSELADAEHVRPQSMAETVTALKKAGLVASQRDLHDRRRMLITATAQGKRIARELTEAREHWLAEAVDSVTEPAQRRLLWDAAELMHQLADEGVPSPNKAPRRGKEQGRSAG
ncbi:MarR family transcriptional regulator [Dactylosporangium sp. NPDC051484]|uniref:MarR family winged helix-turn-helix transcriptional regulator n=1 Tax=Dactylosporangium sp. NPDC051484 TaxID=3154942 RepID=UPI00344D0F3B